ncbi:MAG: hypothetical protein KJO84_02090, partial [Acidimicrobiia bacterium]|nr:hypothetical protein [Acidimicrobiia bacterium]
MDETVDRRDFEADGAVGAPAPDTDESTIDPERRRLLIWGIGAIGAGMTAAIGVPAVLYATGPTRGSAGEDEWIRL